ncbi:MAG: carbon-nitrogen hydrolase family protein [Clostridia bacterium]|nr:carbon-nitrogen hydrolase family protein [Clostridia bacterium]
MARINKKGRETMLNIAFLQLLPGGSLSEQLSRGMAACREAKAKGADIALFPEMWSAGYSVPQEQEALEAASLGPDSMFIKCFASLARELEMAIGITYLEAYGAFSRNSLALFDMRGRRVLDYAKVHTCDFSDERVLARGNDFYVCELETAKGEVKVGAMICYDREFPESARLLMLKGAELILVPNACPMEINRLSQLRGRAYENMLAIATCNYPGGHPDCNGHSTLFDGVAYLPEDEDSRDTCVFEAGSEPGVYTAQLDLDTLRAYRKTEVHGNAYRRPELYGRLINERVDEPFKRKDRRI